MYRTFTVNLATVTTTNPTELVPAGTRIAEIIVLDAGGEFQIRVGAGNDWITVPRAFSMEPLDDEYSNRGLHVRNNLAQAGVTVEVIVVFGDNRAGLNPKVS